MMTEQDAVSFAKYSAFTAIDQAADYEDSVAELRENIRDTLAEQGASEHEAAAFAAYDARIVALRK